MSSWRFRREEEIRRFIGWRKYNFWKYFCALKQKEQRAETTAPHTEQRRKILRLYIVWGERCVEGAACQRHATIIRGNYLTLSKYNVALYSPLLPFKIIFVDVSFSMVYSTPDENVILSPSINHETVPAP